MTAKAFLAFPVLAACLAADYLLAKWLKGSANISSNLFAAVLGGAIGLTVAIAAKIASRGIVLKVWRS